MIIDRNLLKEYPFDGYFYKFGIDKDKPLEEQVEEEILVCNVKCDIQEASSSDSNGNISATFNVYFQFDNNKDFEIQRGMFFKGSVYGLEVNGIVDSIIPTQLGCACRLKDRDV